jgi:hypothetical protein
MKGLGKIKTNLAAWSVSCLIFETSSSRLRDQDDSSTPTWSISTVIRSGVVHRKRKTDRQFQTTNVVRVERISASWTKQMWCKPFIHHRPWPDLTEVISTYFAKITTRLHGITFQRQSPSQTWESEPWTSCSTASTLKLEAQISLKHQQISTRLHRLTSQDAVTLLLVSISLGACTCRLLCLTC